MKLSRKHFLIINSLIFIIVTVILCVLYVVMPQHYEEKKAEEAQNEFAKVVKLIDGKDLTQAKKILASKEGVYKNTSVWYLLFDAEDNIVYPKSNLEIEESLSEEDSQWDLLIASELFQDDSESDEVSSKRFTKSVRIEDKVFILAGDFSLQPVSEARKVLLDLYPPLLLFSLVIGTIASYFYSHVSNRRLLAISATIRKMAKLEPDLSCNDSGNDEISELAQDINSLYRNLFTVIASLRKENEKVAENEREKSEFLRITSHELKTPMAGVIGMLDGMIYKVGDFKDRDKYLRKCREILEEQSLTVQSLLEFSKVDFISEQSEETFNLKTVLEEELKAYTILVEARQFHLEVQLDDCEVVGNKLYLLKAIKNLLDNALHYTKEHGGIEIRLRSEDFVIKNQAEHCLTIEQLGKIFQPLYRPDFSRNRKAGGSGLGLFITQQILEKHHFAYTFDNVEDDWMAFRIRFEEV
ncbi:HAMP domain-containing sensor histidine kinase [Streptococcus merionis]|uniref:HAMP domain-containing sensor histidine kinase n=1 Tax=Streptococcus merionis TaxID=400065 RepID=UPI0026EBB966|nr:HAMP domain-containing sensor histidine kinase [Streptococcus merionis]